MKILGIETSCDETAVAVAEGKKSRVKILSNIISSQIDIHKKYGGVVPEVAAREHVLSILPVLAEALEKAETRKEEIDAIAVASGPGLISSLMVGAQTAKAFSFVSNKPLISVNHIVGHIYANFIDKAPKEIKFPALVLTVSGGHTQLILMTDHGRYKIIGETRDDAAGEAFDKASKLLGLGYPGGPAISREAEKFRGEDKINFPRPMIDSPNFDFSFSGLKTAVLYTVKKDKNYKKRLSEYAFAFEEAVVDVLVKKTIKAGKKYKAETIMLSGGVSANKKLRQTLSKQCKKELNKNLIIPELQFTTDNAAMIASAGYFKYLRGEVCDWKGLGVDCSLEI